MPIYICIIEANKCIYTTTHRNEYKANSQLYSEARLQRMKIGPPNYILKSYIPNMYILSLMGALFSPHSHILNLG